MPRPSCHVLVIAALTACTAPPPPVAGSSPAPAPSSVAPKAPLAVDDQTLHDLSLIVGGNFSPDHMGPEAYDAIVARYRAAPGKYLEALLARYARTDPNPALHGDSFIAWFLEQLHPSDPAGTERAAKVFHDLWGQATADPSLDPRVRLQLEEQLATVTVLAGGIDRPFSPAWVATTADRICASSVPEGHGVTLQNDCTCGQPMACHAELGSRDLRVTLVKDDQAPAVCHDCYPTWTTCRVPRLSPGQSLAVSVNGQARGTFTANDAGWLPVTTYL